MRLRGIPEPTSTRWRAAAVILTVIAVGAVVSTYHVFNNFYDEPAHIAAGMEWLSRGTYTLEPQHPPLSRVASALLPWLAGETSHGHTNGNTYLYTEGREILGRGAHYQRMLTLARVGQLPFLLILAFVVWAWTRRLSDERTAAIAVGLILANPNILAHAGIAGTDIGPAALMPAALLAWALWLEAPSTKRSVMMGVAVALCGLTKFSAGAYWAPAAAMVAFVHFARRPAGVTVAAALRRLQRPFVFALTSAVLMTWAAYRFSVGPVGDVTLPAPALWLGLREFFAHGTGGHPSYLLGEVRLEGWWYYDIIALAVKTPIPEILLALAGVWLLRADALPRRGNPTTQDTQRSLLQPALFAGVISVLLLASLTPVDIGVRLDLPIYAMLCVLAALAASRALASDTKWMRASVLALGAWTVAIPVASHPDHIAYFNALAGPEPDRVLVDSNLDWGQDLYRLRDAMKEAGMDSLRIHYFGTAEFAAVGLERARRLRPNEHATGWVAASETFYAGVWADSALNWLHAYTPVARIGSSIRLYHIVPRN
ncbi:MAG TPA: glycosyltransferase family 39 protein [Gemmatimonadaceae bacterium]